MLELFLAAAAQAGGTTTEPPLKVAYGTCVKTEARRLAKANADAGDTADAALAACAERREAWFKDMITRKPAYGSTAAYGRVLEEELSKHDQKLRREALLAIIDKRAK